jgi:uncharacterized DUF497 family protein
MAYPPFVPIEWDEAKNLANQWKHEVSFQEAQQLFDADNDYMEIFDRDHSDFEDRFIAIGPIDRGLILVVYTELEDDITRIISARSATKREQALYRAHMEQIS